MSSSPDDCTYSLGVVSSSICRSSGMNKTDSLSLVSVVVQAVYSAATIVEEEEAIETIQKLQMLLEFQMNLLVVEEEEVADEVETQVVFSVKYVSFSFFFILQPNQLGAG
ncbi:hypothetical protein Tco_0056473 [Tanacetum coccineum]